MAAFTCSTIAPRAPMNDALLVAVGEGACDLAEQPFGLCLAQVPVLVDVLQQVAAARQLHHHERVLVRVQQLEQPDLAPCVSMAINVRCLTMCLCWSDLRFSISRGRNLVTKFWWALSFDTIFTATWVPQCVIALCTRGRDVRQQEAMNVIRIAANLLSCARVLGRLDLGVRAVADGDAHDVAAVLNVSLPGVVVCGLQMVLCRGMVCWRVKLERGGLRGGLCLADGRRHACRAGRK